jgi:hypothetical protein
MARPGSQFKFSQQTPGVNSDIFRSCASRGCRRPKALDKNSIWNYREALTRAKIDDKPAIEGVFKRFEAALTKADFLAIGETDGRRHDCRCQAA